MTTFSTTSPIISSAVELPGWAKRSVNLANPRLGARALFATDQFFAPMERMLNPDPAVFIPGQYDDNGKWMDGWESRRKRTAGHDWGIVKLGRHGTLSGFDVDTSHFTGNFAPALSIDATFCESDDVEILKQAPWTEILPSQSLQGNSHHLLEVALELRHHTYSHLKINIYPDGGIARLRVYGHPSLDKVMPGTSIDLVAMENGGRAVAWNDAHFGIPQNLILPGKGVNMGDGWETRRRREPGNDWCIFALGRTGIVKKIEVDTAFFKGNYPDRCSFQAALIKGGTDQSLITQSMFWPVLLPEQKLEMDKVFTYTHAIAQLGSISHIRFNIFPDGGVSRIRLWGEVS